VVNYEIKWELGKSSVRDYEDGEEILLKRFWKESISP
jgi:hypothetical protein